MRWLATLCARLTVIFFVSQVAVLAAHRLPYRDPFAQYQSIGPGQPSTGLKAFPCTLPVQGPPNTTTAYCRFVPSNGPFGSVTIEYSQSIKRIGFSVLPGRLYLGELIRCWGKPSGVQPDFSAPASGILNIHWNQRYFASFDPVRYGARLSSFVPVSYIILAGDWRPCRAWQ
jgi:hypothetical protein